ncbi:MAG: hypothetical protein Q7W05_15215 [Deltaproteobacteria bacterium]|jgi:hypothetical protein|nr:hypothetical protein [Deltaproteobacteria bacterium]
MAELSPMSEVLQSKVGCEKRRIVLVDIDGTISKLGDRLVHLQGEKPDWDSFYSRCHEDEPIKKIAELVRALARSYEVVYCSGRREDVKKLTIGWFAMHDIYWMQHTQVLMRKRDDYRHDVDVKPELLQEAGIGLDEIEFVLEDRNCMVKKWRDLGLTCLQVADGDF